MEKIKMRVRVMCYAHQIFRNTNKDWSNSLITAWQLYFCLKKMSKGPVKFYYKKIDGDYRCAFGQIGNLPFKYQKSKRIVNRPSFRKIVTYYDLERDQFRCFKVENFVHFSKTWNKK